MNSKNLIIIFSLLLCCCNTQKQKEEVKIIHDTIVSYPPPVIIKYAMAYIIGGWDDPDSLQYVGMDGDKPIFKHVRNKLLYLSDIQQINNPTEESQYKFLDSFQTGLKSKASGAGVDFSIISRKVILYDSYKESSEARFALTKKPL